MDYDEISLTDLDSVLLTETGSLLVDFGTSGTSGRFKRINVGSANHGERYAIALLIETELVGETEMFHLILETQDYEYFGDKGAKLRRTVLETFLDEPAANAARTVVKSALSQSQKPVVEVAEEPKFTLQEKSKFSRIGEVAVTALCCTALVMVGVGVLLGGLSMVHKFY